MHTLANGVERGAALGGSVAYDGGHLGDDALAVQMVVGNAIQMPTSLFTPASTLTSVLTMGMGNEAMGTVYNDVLWSLALLLLLMSLVFILIIHLIGHKGGTRRG